MICGSILVLSDVLKQFVITYFYAPTSAVGQSGDPSKRLKKLSAPANEKELQAFQAACERAELPCAEVLRRLANAFVVHMEEKGRVVFPLRITDSSKRNGQL